MLPALAALLVSVAAAVTTALAFLLPAHRGLTPPLATACLLVGLLAGGAAWFHVRRREALTPPTRRRFSGWAWALMLVFALFALRSFCWLLYADGDQLYIGSPDNLGDLSLHLQMARYFADGAPWWPAHPEAAGQPLRYYPGINLLHALLLSVGADDGHVLVWMGLVGSVAAAVAIYRWGGTFTVAGFLFSGGLAGWQFFRNGIFDYQHALAWKSLPLTIFVTQRPFLYALPAGLLLMIHWRRKFFTDLPPPARALVPGGAPTPPAPGVVPGLLPFWVEALLYATLPVFHLFAFLFLSTLLAWWLVAYVWRPAVRWHVLGLVAVSLVPASYQVALMTNHFTGTAGTLHLQWGWMGQGHNFLGFWLLNFGAFALLAPALWGQLIYWKLQDAALPSPGHPPAADLRTREIDAATAFVLPAGLLFVVACNLMFARWDWDNTKLMIWCYLAFLPFLWRLWIRPLALPLRAPLCVLLFFSGAVSLAGGLSASHLRYALTKRSDYYGVRHVVTALPAQARYACAPDYNHPLVYCGRALAMGYDGHLYSQNIDYVPLRNDLNTLMLGQPGWEQIPAKLGVRYLFWGTREAQRWPSSTRPWEGQPPIAAGAWGSLYEVGQ